MTYDLSERDQKILQAIVQDYIQTAEPVGSRSLSKRHGLDLSPATIRNVMADLEDMGLLMQPHTSAGRVPTDRGLRFYVDTMLEVKGISSRDQQAISRQFTGSQPEVEHLLRLSSKVLSSISRHIGIVLAPRFSRLILRQVEFIRLNNRLLLVVLVGKFGMIQNRIIEVDENLSQEVLDSYNRYLNEILEGLTISEIKTRIVGEMRQEKIKFDRMLSRALELSQKVFADSGLDEDIYMDGQGNLLDSPEFADVDIMKAIFRTFENKSILVKLLDKTLNASGVQIFIGSENELAEMAGFTIITSSYTRGTHPLGALGVIGPTRLNYSKIIPVVDYTAKLVSHILESNL